MLDITPLWPSGSVEWDKQCLSFTGYDGRESKRWVNSGMPRLGQYNWLPDAVFFLYENKEDAKKGVKSGGTGFLVSIPSENWPNDFHHTYGITNWHNPCKAGASVIRVNRTNGEPEVLDFDSSEWSFIPGPQGYDIAAIDLTESCLRPLQHKIQSLGPSFILTPSEIEQQEIGPADDVFMIGRFVDYDGVEVNEPSLRFGHISIAKASIKQPNSCVRPSYVIDMHSRTGFSGSPVFVYRTHGSIFAKQDSFIAGGHLMKLLGVHWGQFPEEWEIKQGVKKTAKQEASFITEGAYVKGLSGMSCVCPATAILEVLDMPELKKRRQEREQTLTSEGFGRGLPVAESASHSTAANPTHLEDFNLLLNAASQKPTQAG